MFNDIQVYPSHAAFLNDIDRNEKVTGRGEGGIYDTITKQFLGYWVLNNNGTVNVSWA